MTRIASTVRGAMCLYKASFLKTTRRRYHFPMNQNVELVDLVDSSGQIQQKGIPRTEIDRFPDLRLQIVIVVVFDSQGRILVHKRGMSKKVNPGDIDHICGGVHSNESVEQAASRETLEEAGIEPDKLKVVLKGVNKYNRYRTLLIGESTKEPKVMDPGEVEWVRFIHPDELKAKMSSGEFTFVDEFFEDTALAVQQRELNEAKREKLRQSNEKSLK